jgi:signal transduction histidine kinase
MTQFAQIAAHDLKAPLHNISTMANLLRLDYGDKVDEEGRQWMDLITNSTEKLKTLIDGLLAYSKTGGILSESYTEVPPIELQRDVSRLFSNHAHLQMDWQINDATFYCNRTALEQILINLISNAIKYNDKELTEVTVRLNENITHYTIQVTDNGPGISENQHAQIFKIFEVLSSKDRFGQRGNGIGLATVKKLVEAMQGDVQVESELGKGATFTVRIKKDIRIVENPS